MNRILLLLCLAISASAVVAEDDLRDHPTCQEVLRAMHDITTMHMDAMQQFGLAIGVRLKPGFKVAAVQFINANGAVIVCPDIPANAPLILVQGVNFVVGIHQVDQDAPLGTIHDAMKEEAITENAVALGILNTIERVLDTYFEPRP